MRNQFFKQQVADLSEILKQHAVRHVILCPGSRNAPLMQVFERDNAFICHSIVDERSAGYVALGMAKQLNEPAAVITTSGTAALNLAPAVAEAYNQQIPLIVITADRPEEWPPQFTNQRIIQPGIFSQNCKHTCIVPPDSVGPEIMKEALEKVSRFLADARTPRKGPVHINITFEEPLYEAIAEPTFSGNISTKIPAEEADYNEKVVNTIKTAFTLRKKVLIVAGMAAYSKEETALLDKLIYGFETVIIAENLGNLKNENIISAPELVLGYVDEKQRKELVPDLIITFGGQVVSKRTRIFVKSSDDVPIAAFRQFPVDVFKKILEDFPIEEGENSYSGNWKKMESEAWAKAASYLETAPFGNLTATLSILDSLPPNCTLHLGNSGTVRYAQLRPARKGHTYFANRGTSGIDGSLSTAAGAAMVSDDPHFLIIGDLSFVYDSNGLWNRTFPKNLKIIVLNDKGGGIFRLLDGPDRMPFFEEYSIAYHPVSLKHLAEAFGIVYLKANNYESLDHALVNLMHMPDNPVVLEVDTHKSENSRIFKSLFTSLRDS